MVSKPESSVAWCEIASGLLDKMACSSDWTTTVGIKFLSRFSLISCEIIYWSKLTWINGSAVVVVGVIDFGSNLDTAPVTVTEIIGLAAYYAWARAKQLG